MALIFCDSSDDGLSIHKWTQQRLPVDLVTGRTGPSGFSVNTGNPDVRRRKTFVSGDPGIHATWIVGFACAAGSMGSNTSSVSIMLFRSGNNVSNRLSMNWFPVTRQMGFNTNSGQFAITDALDVGVWHYIEIKFTMHDVTGYAEVRIDGDVLGTFSGDTIIGGSGSTLDTVEFRSGDSFTGGGVISFDDLYLLNGDSPNNDFIGDTKIYHLLPDGNGTYSELDGSDGDSINNYLLVDESPNPNTSDYVGSSIMDAKDTYTFQDIVDVAPNVAGVVVRSYAAKSTTGNRKFRPVLRKDGIDYSGTDTTLSTSYSGYEQIYDLTPDGLPWTKSIVNALEAGFQVR